MIALGTFTFLNYNFLEPVANIVRNIIMCRNMCVNFH